MKIVFASNNPGKINELKFFFKDLPFTIISQNEMDVAEVDETGETFIENAILKARNACAATKLPAIADDSGLVIPALHGAPGVYSARYAGLDSNSQKNITKVLQELKSFPNEKDRHAYFYCVIVFMQHEKDPTPIVCEASWHGVITKEVKGKDGFGYDPIFYVPTENKTAAELSSLEKNSLSHRGKALQQLLARLTKD